MKPIIVRDNVLVGGMWYEPRNTVQMVPDAVADHLIKIGSAIAYETKVIEITEEKKTADVSPVSPPAQASPAPTVKRRGRPPKVSS